MKLGACVSHFQNSLEFPRRVNKNQVLVDPNAVSEFRNQIIHCFVQVNSIYFVIDDLDLNSVPQLSTVMKWSTLLHQGRHNSCCCIWFYSTICVVQSRVKKRLVENKKFGQSTTIKENNRLFRFGEKHFTKKVFDKYQISC